MGKKMGFESHHCCLHPTCKMHGIFNKIGKIRDVLSFQLIPQMSTIYPTEKIVRKQALKCSTEIVCGSGQVPQNVSARRMKSAH